jgi:predicted amidohydrolase
VKGVNLFFLPSAFPLSRVAHWRILTQARAIENQAFVVAANRVGTDADVTFGGSSSIIDPGGVILASGHEAEEEMVCADIEVELAIQSRRSLGVLRDRRKDVYLLELRGDGQPRPDSQACALDRNAT